MRKYAIGALLALVLLTGSAYAYGMGGFGNNWYGRGPKMMGYGYQSGFNHPCGGYAGSQLTDEQKTKVQEKIDELTKAGKTPQEIRSEVHKLLAEFGITTPFVDEDGDGICDYAQTGGCLGFRGGFQRDTPTNLKTVDL